MYSEQIRRKKSNTFYEMHTIGGSGSSGNLQFTKLAGSIVTAMESLEDKKAAIMTETNVARLATQFMEFQRKYDNFMTLQKDFFELDESNPETERLKLKIKSFLESIKMQEIENRLESLKKEKIRSNERKDIQKRVENSQQSSVLSSNRQQIVQKLLQEQQNELKVIESLIDRIKSIAIKTSALIYEQGQQLNIAASTMKSVKTKLGDAKNELVEGNKYQQSTNRNKLFMCLLIVIVVVIILMIIIASKK